jgi:hypothetical protein
MARSKPLKSASAEINATQRVSRSLRNQQCSLAPLGQRLGGGELRPVAALAAFHLDKFCDLFVRDSAARSRATIVDNNRPERSLSSTVKTMKKDCGHG